MSENREFEIVADIQVPATPDRVWEAITTGTPAWMFPTDQWPAEFPVNERPSHLISRMDGPDGWFNQLEHVIEPLPDGRASIHYVHSGIFADNWDQQYDGASKHTAFYLHTLGQYLEHFDGKPVVFTDIQGPATSATPEAFDQFKGALGIAGSAVGDKVDVMLDGVGQLRGDVDFVNENFVGIRTQDALLRFFGRNNFGAVVGMTVHDFSAPSDPAARSEETAVAWSAFFASVYGE
ncbi:SRPBCC domain-containing protein [Pseudarthrobacter sp. J1763]|uniref:SRPBCC domain-containing protein n=1 Tax=Pseudarthrobacter sp. J1763 TaxID=3420445 RepID=UPI003D2E1A26